MCMLQRRFYGSQDKGRLSMINFNGFYGYNISTDIFYCINICSIVVECCIS